MGRLGRRPVHLIGHGSIIYSETHIYGYETSKGEPMVTLGNPFRSEHKVSSRIGRRIAAFHDLISGPAMTEQERKRATMAGVENSRRISLLIV